MIQYHRLLSGLIIEDVTPTKVIFHYYAEVKKTLVQRDAGLASPSSVKSICREEDIARTDEVSSLKSEVAPVVNVGYAPCSRLVRC